MLVRLIDETAAPNLKHVQNRAKLHFNTALR